MLTSVNTGDTLWMLICSAFVFLMIPGLTFFYGGLFRKKEMLPMLSFSVTLLCLITLQWILLGYSLSYGPDHNGWTGTLAWMGLHGVGAEPNMEYAGSIPQTAFMIYRGMLAILPPVIFLSPFADRLKQSALYVIALLWSMVVIDPVMHWVWGVGGFLRIAGTFDFAGGMPIYLTSGMATLAMMLVLKKPLDRSVAAPPSQSLLTLAWFGAAILWFGEFGVMIGSAHLSPEVAVNAFVTMQVAATTSGIVWIFLDKLLNQKLTSFGLMTGAIAGIAAISPAAGYVNAGGAFGIGAGAAIFCYAALAFLRKKFGPHDALYAICLFGGSGLWGSVATGLWATKSVNATGEDGLFYGNPVQFLIQLKATLAIALYTFGISYLLLKFLDVAVGLLRPSET